MSKITYDQTTGRMIELWDDQARTYTAFDLTGAIIASRPYTPEESAAVELHEANLAELKRKAVEVALPRNKDFLALTTPTNAQVLAQTRLLTREVNSVIRVLYHLTDDISDT